MDLQAAHARLLEEEFGFTAAEVKSKEHYQEKLKEACENRNAPSIDQCLAEYPALAHEMLLVTNPDGTTMKGYPLSFLLLCTNFHGPIGMDVENEIHAEDDFNFVHEEMMDMVSTAGDAMWPSQLMEGEPRHLPLVIACQNPSLSAQVLVYLINKAPQAVGVQVGDCTPLQLYLQKAEGPNLEVVELMNRAYPKCLLDPHSGPRCLSIALQNPGCGVGVWEFLLQKRQQGPPVSSFSLTPEIGMDEGVVNGTKIQHLMQLLPKIREFSCDLSTVAIDSMFDFCSTLAGRASIRFTNLVLVIPQRVAGTLRNQHRWGLLEIVRNNPLIQNLAIDAEELEIDLDPFVEALKVNTHLKSLSFSGKLSSASTVDVASSLENILTNHNRTLERATVGDWAFERETNLSNGTFAGLERLPGRGCSDP